MKTEYTLKGLGCANCAAKIEAAVQKTAGVVSASLIFVKSVLRVEWDEAHQDGGLEKIKKIVRSIESGVTVTEKTEQSQAAAGDAHDECCCGHAHDSADGGSVLRVVQLISGAAVFAAGLFLQHLFSVNEYITLGVYIAAYLILGSGIVLRAVKNIVRGKIFDENFLMVVATVGAFVIGETAEAAGVMLFYQIGMLFQDLAVKKAKKSIANLMDIRPDYANVEKNGELVKVAPETVGIGDVIVVKAGEKVPLDGVVEEGEAMLDTAALTGESVPRRVVAGDTVLSGSVNQNGLLKIKVTQTFGESTVSKIIDLVENAAEKKSPTENFITKFSRYYTPVVVGLAALLAVLPPLFIGASDAAVWSEWVNRALIFLVISCPCALVVSIPLGFFGGIGGAARKGVLIKGSNYLEALNNVKIAVFDKTGTLTKGVFKVTQILPANNFTAEEVLAAAAKAEAFSNHPVAQSILKEYGGQLDKSSLKNYKETAGSGVSVNDGGKVILAGNAALMQQENIAFEESQSAGTKVYIAVEKEFAGCIVISDEIKSDSCSLIAALKSKGIRTVMLTGDNPEIAKVFGEQIGVDEFYGGLLPQQKVEKVQWLSSQKGKSGKLVFVGDGINDAPVLALSDIGVSMGGLGSDAAIEASDIVIMNDEPSKLLAAIETAKFTRRIVLQNIVFALGIKGLFLALGAFGIASMWEAVFADVGVALLAVLNSLRAIAKRK